MKKSTSITFKIPDAELKILKEEANRRGITTAALLVELIKKYFEGDEWKHGK